MDIVIKWSGLLVYPVGLNCFALKVLNKCKCKTSAFVNWKIKLFHGVLRGSFEVPGRLAWKPENSEIFAIIFFLFNINVHKNWFLCGHGHFIRKRRRKDDIYSANYFIFSVDVMSKPLKAASQWSDTSPLGSRSTFSSVEDKTGLIIDQVLPQVITGY